MESPSPVRDDEAEGASEGPYAMESPSPVRDDEAEGASEGP
jgi:hypothetical protein